MFYATHDSEGGKITAEANVSAFATRAEAEGFLLSMYGDEWDKSKAEFKSGWFGDYWVQTHRRPDFSGLIGDWCNPFIADQLRVNPPGSHPGGPFYWIEPIPEILIVTGIFEKATDSNWEKRHEMIAMHAWETWTKNGLGMNEDDRYQTERHAQDASNNAYLDDMTDQEWLDATLKSLKVKL